MAAVGIVRIKVEGLIDIAHLATAGLGLGQEFERQGRFARGGGTDQFAQLALRQTADAQRPVEARKPGGDVRDGGCRRSPLDQRLGTVAALDGRYGHV